MKKKILYAIAALAAVLQTAYGQTYPPLGTENNFTVLAGTQVTSSGNTVINGAVGVSPGSTLTGFPPGVINGSTHLNNTTAQNAKVDLASAYANLQAQAATANFSGQNLGGKVLQPGVYKYNGTATLDGVLTLDASGDPDGTFVFQIGGHLNVAANASIVLLEGARARNVFFQVTNTTSIGAGAAFKGSVLSKGSITVAEGAAVNGRLMSLDSFVQFTNVAITTPLPTSLADLEVVKTASPEPHYDGQSLAYTITVRNLGPSKETNVLVRDVLPAGVTFVSSSASVSTYNPNTGIWPIESIDVGVTQTLSINVRIAATTFITNTATIAAEGRDENSTNNSSTVTICALPKAPGAISGPGSVCRGSTDNVYTIATVPGITQYKWTVPDGWAVTSGQGSTSISVVSGNQSSTGTIVVTAVNVCGEGQPTSLTVFSTTVAPTNLGPITGNISPCNGSTGNTFSVAAVPGADKYSWTVPADWTVVSGQGTPIITVSAGAQSGRVTVTASNGCGKSNTVGIDVAASLVKPAAPAAILGNLNACVGLAGQVYSVAPVAGATSYNWTLPAGWTITAGQGTTAITATPGANGGNISVTASNGCGSSTTTVLAVSVSTARPAAPELITGNSAPCAGSTATTYSVAPVTGANAYNWTVPSGWSITSGQGTTSITVTVGTGTGNISVTASNGCGASTAATLAVKPSTAVPPAPGAITGNALPCSGSSGLVYSIAAVSNASSYAWTVPSGWTITAGQGSTSITVTPGSGSGNISITASNGCGVSPASTLAVTPTAAAPTTVGPISGIQIPCQNSTGNVFSVAAVAGASSYAWTVPSGWAITGGQGTASITVRAGTGEGAISVTASNGCGTSSPASFSVRTASAGPFSLGAISGNQVPCAGSSATYSVPAIPDASAYSWTVPSGWTITAGQGSAAITVTPGTSGGSVVVVASNGCGAGQPVTLQVTSATAKPPRPEPIIGPASPCAGQTGAIFSVQPLSSASSYTWTVPSGWAITAGQGTTAITVTVGAANGTVSVVAANGCGTSDARTLDAVLSIAAPSVPGAIAGPGNVCANSEGNVYSVEAAAGSSYIWTAPTGWTILSGQGTPSVVVRAGTANGNMSVTASNGCGASAASIRAVTVSAQAPATPGPITGNLNPCRGSTGLTYTISAVAGATSYTWTVPGGWTITAGQGTPSISVTADGSGGTVSVRAGNACGNSAASTLNVTLNSLAPSALGTITGTSAPCRSSAGNTYSVAVISAANSFIWTVPVGWVITSGQGTSAISVTAGMDPGTVSVIALNDCGASAPSTLGVSPAATPPAETGPITGSSVPCSGNTSATYSVEAVGGVSTYAWTVPAGWAITAGQGTRTITVTIGPGPGTVSVVASNGCGAAAARELAVAPSSTRPAKPDPIVGEKNVCSGQTGIVYSVPAVAGADFYTWSLPTGWAITAGSGTNAITVTPGENGGTISVNATNGCGDTDKSTLEVTPVAGTPIKPEAILGSPVPCIGGSGITYRVDPVTGATTYTWKVPAGWTITAGQGTTAITVSPSSGEGNLTVTASNGCGTSTEAVLAVKPTAAAPGALGAIAGNSSVCRGNAAVTFSVAAIADVAAYTWTVPAGWTITAGQGTPSLTVTPGSGAGTVQVIAKNDCGESPAVSLEVTSSEAAPGSLGEVVGNRIPCVGSGSTVYQVVGLTGNFTYTWTVPSDWKITTGQGTKEIIVEAGSGAGTVSVVTSNACGESPVSSLEVTPATAPPPAPGPISGESSLCSGQQGVTYSIALVPTASHYTWTVPAGWTITSGQGTPSITVNAGGTPGTLEVSASNGCGTGDFSTLGTTFLPAAAPPNGIADESAPCKGLVFSVPEVMGATSYTWTVPEGWTIVSGQGSVRIQVKANSPTGEISVVSNSGSCASLPVTMQAEAAKGESNLTIPNVFSPNGDGINDTWVVSNLQQFPDNEMVILNRWGSELLRRKGYQNDWNGNDLSPGTYYYVLRVKECQGGEKTYRGFVMIVK